MKRLSSCSLCLLIVFILSSCSHRVNRIGYSEKPLDSSSTCDVIIQKEQDIDESANQKIGSIKLKDSGFSTACDELDAIAILKKEACSIGGNMVNIVEESRPNFVSTCYQCTADIYEISNDSLAKKIIVINEYDSTKALERVDEDKKRNRTIFWTSFAVGFMIGFILVL